MNLENGIKEFIAIIKEQYRLGRLQSVFSHDTASKLKIVLDDNKELRSTLIFVLCIVMLFSIYEAGYSIGKFISYLSN